MRTASIIALMMNAVCTSETSVHSSETSRRYIPEYCHLYISFILFVVYLTTLSVVCRMFDEEERINRNMEGRSRGLIKDRISVFSWKD
jgi:hypothetical protein